MAAEVIATTWQRWLIVISFCRYFFGRGERSANEFYVGH